MSSFNTSWKCQTSLLPFHGWRSWLPSRCQLTEWPTRPWLSWVPPHAWAWGKFSYAWSIKDLIDYIFQIHTIPFLARWTSPDKSLGVPPLTMLPLHMATHVLRDAFVAFYLIHAFTVSVFTLLRVHILHITTWDIIEILNELEAHRYLRESKNKLIRYPFQPIFYS